MKASFSKGYAADKLAQGRAPLVGRLNTGDTIVDFEMSFPKERAWQLYNFLIELSDQATTPQKAIDEAFNEKPE